MAPTSIDPAQLIHAYLSAQTAFMAAITNRLYGPPNESIPAGISAPCAFVTFDLDGGPASPDVPTGRLRVSFNCYGASPAESRTTYRYLHDAMQRAGRATVSVSGKTWVLNFATRSAGPAAVPEPQIGWPRFWAAYEVTYTEWALA